MENITLKFECTEKIRPQKMFILFLHHAALWVQSKE